MSSARNRERLQRLVDEAETGVPREAVEEWRERGRLAVKAATEGSDQVDRWDAIRYTPGIWTTSTPSSFFDEAEADGVRDACSMLRALIEDIDEALHEPDLPAASIGAVHRWVADAAAGLWADGHRQQAVQSAASALETRLKLKPGVNTGSISSIIGKAFSLKPPEPDSPRLRFHEFDPGSDEWNNAHDGASAFGRGCMVRIRNLYTHNTGATEAEDLEALAALSLLARWVDSADVERADSG